MGRLELTIGSEEDQRGLLRRIGQALADEGGEHVDVRINGMVVAYGKVTRVGGSGGRVALEIEEPAWRKRAPLTAEQALEIASAAAIEGGRVRSVNVDHIPEMEGIGGDVILFFKEGVGAGAAAQDIAAVERAVELKATEGQRWHVRAATAEDIAAERERSGK